MVECTSPRTATDQKSRNAGPMVAHPMHIAQDVLQTNNNGFGVRPRDTNSKLTLTGAPCNQGQPNALWNGSDRVSGDHESAVASVDLPFMLSRFLSRRR